MCGIVGGMSKSINKDIAEKMTAVLSRRGPDADGVFFDEKNKIFLGHRRLSVIGLSELANQPMSVEFNGKKYFISYNGEVYNYKEIKKELDLKGYKFKTDSDTEVVLCSYIEWGDKCVEKFHGMFAFVIWDESGKELILFRDRFGVKPLYYYFDGENFIFASELKTIYQFPNFRKDIDFDALALYLQFGFIPAPHTIFKNTFKLEQGSILKIGADLNIKKQKYWQPENYFKTEKIIKSEKEILGELEEILKKSFQCRMIADVEVGVFLSGGIDSSLVAAILQNNSSKKIKTFTIGFEEKSYNEAPFAKKIADYLKTDHYEYYVSANDMKNSLLDYADIFDEPFGDSSALLTYLLAKFARKDAKVTLSGDGGDELFFGYDKYNALRKIKNIPRPIKKVMRSVINFLGPDKLANIHTGLAKILPLPKYSNLREKLSKLDNLLSGKDLAENFLLSGSYWIKEEIKDLLTGRPLNNESKNIFQYNNVDFREQMQIWDIKNYLVNDILFKTDMATMAASLEAREPYLDQDILEYIAKISPDIKFNKNPKYFLKKILSKYLPSDLIDRPKAGFRLPIYECLKKDWKDMVYYYLDPDKIEKQGIFDKNFIESLLEKYYHRDQYINPDKLWLILNFQLWHEKWMK